MAKKGKRLSTFRVFKLASGTVTFGGSDYYGVISMVDVHAFLETIKTDGQTINIKSAKVLWYLNPSSPYYHSSTPFLVSYQNGGTFSSTMSGSLSEINSLLDSAINTPFGVFAGPTHRLTPNSNSQYSHTWDITKPLQSQMRFVEARESVHPELAIGCHCTGNVSTTCGVGVVLVIEYTASPVSTKLFLKG